MRTQNLHDDFVEQVRSSSDILSVISSYVHLKKRGNRYWGCCPFHNEKTPSFSVVPQQGFFYCFGCHAGGNLFKFISLIENISYYEAIKLQAQRLNIPIPTTKKSADELKQEQQKDSLFKIHELAGSFFHNCLTRTSLGEAGRAYFSSRQINSDIITKFKLGFAPNLWDKLFTSFTKRGITKELLAKAGLITIKDSGKVYDRFRNRIIIPIMNEHGQICGFGGRIINPNDSPKYLNSPETLIFNKRHLLFGLDHAQKSIKENNFSIVVEGYMDAISLHAAGIDWAVASMGTAFAQEQAKLLARAADEVVFSYDSDAAGQRATVRAVSIAKEAGLKVRVLIVPDGKDPDEFVRKHGKDAYLRLIETAVSGIEFQMQYVISQNNVSNLAGKVEAVSNILPFLLECKNEIEVAQHIKTLAQRLTIDEGLIMSEYRKLSRKNDRREAVSKWQVQPNVLSAEDLAEQLLLYVILKNTDLALVYRDKIDSVGFMSKFRGEIY